MFFRKLKRRVPGFSLIELMVVLAIIGILTTVVTVNVFKARKLASVKAAEAGLEALKRALDMYQLDKREFPRTLDELAKGDFVEKGRLEDPWGVRYHYIPQVSEDGEKVTGFVVYSSGPDRVKDTDDDLGNPKVTKDSGK